jgi:hypothetical protein
VKVDAQAFEAGVLVDAKA